MSSSDNDESIRPSEGIRGNPLYRSIALAESRKYPIEEMVTHRFPLEEAERAVRLVAGEIEGEEAIKVVLIP